MNKAQRDVLTMLAAGGQVRVDPYVKAELYEPENRQVVARIPWTTFIALLYKRLVVFVGGEIKSGEEFWYYGITAAGREIAAPRNRRANGALNKTVCGDGGTLVVEERKVKA